MEKTNLRNKFLSKYNAENNSNLKEYEISKNINYVEWLENEIIKTQNELTGLICTDKEIKTISNDITNELSKKFKLMSIDSFDIQQYLTTYLDSISFRL